MLIHHVSLLQCRIRVRVVTARAYHCLFMHNMLLRPSEAELASFGAPDFTIFNAGGFPANRYTSYMTSSSSVDINLKVNRFKHTQRTFQRFHESTSMFTAAVDCKGTTHSCMWRKLLQAAHTRPCTLSDHQVLTAAFLSRASNSSRVAAGDVATC